MKFLKLLFFTTYLASCSTQQTTISSEKEQKSKGIENNRTTLVLEKKKNVGPQILPVKGKFLDYVYQIQPDHKQEGYSISTDTLNDGYAFGSGYYDGWFVEFFLFRGLSKDYVIKQLTGYEIPLEDQRFGAAFKAYQFENNKMKPIELSQIWPIKMIEELYENQIHILISKKPLAVNDWAFHRLIHLPKKGTTSLIKVCQKNPEPPFLTITDCIIIGELIWNKEKFEIKTTNTYETSSENI